MTGFAELTSCLVILIPVADGRELQGDRAACAARICRWPRLSAHGPAGVVDAPPTHGLPQRRPPNRLLRNRSPAPDPQPLGFAHGVEQPFPESGREVQTLHFLVSLVFPLPDFLLGSRYVSRPHTETDAPHSLRLLAVAGSAQCTILSSSRQSTWAAVSTQHERGAAGLLPVRNRTYRMRAADRAGPTAAAVGAVFTPTNAGGCPSSPFRKASGRASSTHARTPNLRPFRAIRRILSLGSSASGSRRTCRS